MRRIVLVVFFMLVNVNFTAAATFSTYPPKGTIHNAQVIYKDADEVTVKLGYGECNGKYFEVTSATDIDLSTLISGVTEDFVYIYIDDSASYYPTPTFAASFDEPAWSDSNQGWYRQSTGNEDDRCIGVAYVSATSGTLLELKWIGENRYSGVTKSYTENNTPTGSFESTDIAFANYTPVNAIGIAIWMYSIDAGSGVVQVVAQSDDVANDIREYGWDISYCSGWIKASREWDRNVIWKGATNDTAPTFWIRGYEIER